MKRTLVLFAALAYLATCRANDPAAALPAAWSDLPAAHGETAAPAQRRPETCPCSGPETCTCDLAGGRCRCSACLTEPVRLPATVVVECPEGSTLTFDGAPTQQTGTVRTFATPPMPDGRVRTYFVVCRLGGTAETATVRVRARQTVRVRFGPLRETAPVFAPAFAPMPMPMMMGGFGGG